MATNNEKPANAEKKDPKNQPPTRIEIRTLFELLSKIEMYITEPAYYKIIGIKKPQFDKLRHKDKFKNGTITIKFTYGSRKCLKRFIHKYYNMHSGRIELPGLDCIEPLPPKEPRKSSGKKNNKLNSAEIRTNENKQEQERMLNQPITRRELRTIYEILNANNDKMYIPEKEYLEQKGIKEKEEKKGKYEKSFSSLLKEGKFDNGCHPATRGRKKRLIHKDYNYSTKRIEIPELDYTTPMPPPTQNRKIRRIAQIANGLSILNQIRKKTGKKSKKKGYEVEIDINSGKVLKIKDRKSFTLRSRSKLKYQTPLT